MGARGVYKHACKPITRSTQTGYRMPTWKPTRLISRPRSILKPSGGEQVKGRVGPKVVHFELPTDKGFIPLDPNCSVRDDDAIWDPNWFKMQCGAVGTREARVRALAKWDEFLNMYIKRGTPWKQITNDTFEKYAVWRFSTGTVSSDSIDVEISHINHDLHDKGKGLNRKTDCVGLRHVLGGIKRTQGDLFGLVNGKQARALTDRLCDPFCECVGYNDGAIMLVCKHAVLRSDNVCVNKNQHHLCVKHVRVVNQDGEEVVILDIPGSKTNQFHIPEERVLHHRNSYCNSGQLANSLCPACVCKLNIEGRKPDEPLFVKANGKPYGYQYLNNLVKGCAEKFGLNPAYYTTHCLRRGGATDLFKSGKSVDWIMVHCNWDGREVVMKRYLKATNPDEQKPAIRMYWLRH